MAKKRCKREDIPSNELNEWGYPKGDLWKFVGFTKGAGRFIKEDDLEYTRIEKEDEKNDE